MFYFCLIFSLNGLAGVVYLCNLTYSKIQLNYDLFYTLYNVFTYHSAIYFEDF